MLNDLGYSLQAPRKRYEGTAHPDRNDQFEPDRDRFLQRPTSDLGRYEEERVVGNFKNGGREWQPKGSPEAVVHDFPADSCGKAIPYGV